MEQNQEKLEEEVTLSSDLFKRAKQLHSTGCYNEAADLLSRVAETLSQMYGETSLELAEVYYYYGDSLWNISRLSNALFGSEIESSIDREAELLAQEESNEGFNEDQPENEAPSHNEVQLENEVQSHNADQLENERNLHKKIQPEPEKPLQNDTHYAEENSSQNIPFYTNLSNDSNIMDTQNTIEIPQSSNPITPNNPQVPLETDQPDPLPPEEGEGGAEGEDDDSDSENEDRASEVSKTLDLAWEVLEVARKILTPVSDINYQNILSDIHLTLGHIQVDLGNTTPALEDYEKCLAIRQKNF